MNPELNPAVLRDMQQAMDAGMKLQLKRDWHPVDPQDPAAGMTDGQGSFMSTAAFQDMQAHVRQARGQVVAPGRQPVNRKQRRARDKRLATKKQKDEAANQTALSLLMMVLAEHQGTVMVTADNVVKVRTVPMFLKATPQEGGGMLVELLRQEEAEHY